VNLGWYTPEIRYLGVTVKFWRTWRTRKAVREEERLEEIFSCSMYSGKQWFTEHLRW